MLVRLRSLRERLQDSLFLVPSVYVVVMAAMAQVLVEVDSRITEGDLEPPVSLTSTVDATRVVLSTIAGATIAFAGVAFSIALLTLQLASSQFSPRLIQQMFRDKFDKRVIGFVVGTFAYCLVVLMAVRGPLEEGGTPVIPNVSVSIGLLLGLLSLLAVVAFINHAAHQMDVNRLLSDLTGRSIQVVEEQCPSTTASATAGSEVGDAALAASVPESEGRIVRSGEHGWVQSIDTAGVLRATPAGSVVILWIAIGDLVTRDTPLATVWLPPAPPSDVSDDSIEAAVRRAVQTGESRSFDFDYRYGLRQLVDVALKALSPGINDPTTAHEAIAGVTSVLTLLLQRELPPREARAAEDRRLLLGAQTTHADLVALAYDELRVESAGDPTVTRYLLSGMADVVEVLLAAGLDGRADLVRRQARMVGEAAATSGLHGDDLEMVRSHVQRALDGQALPAGALGLGGDPPPGSGS